MFTPEVHEQVEHLAEMLVLADPKDLPSLASLHTEFEGLISSAGSDGHAQLGEVMKVSATWVEKIILDDVESPARVLEDLSQVVANLQGIVRDGRPTEDFRWPAGLGLNGYGANTKTASGGGNGQDAGASAVSEQHPMATVSAPLPAPAKGPSAARIMDRHTGESNQPAFQSRPLEGDPSLLGEFVNEAREHLDAADINLLNLETTGSGGNEDALNAVFRAFHTIKGVAGFLALDEVQRLAHEAESLLDRARKHELDLVGPVMDVTFDAVDMMKRLITNVSEALETGAPLATTPGVPELVRRLKALASGVPPDAGDADAPYVEPGTPLGEILVESGAATQGAVYCALARQRAPHEHKKLGEVLVQSGKVLPTHVDIALGVQRDTPQFVVGGQTVESPKLGDILVDMEVVSQADVEMGLRQQQDETSVPRLGELLVETGQVAAKDVAQALRAQNGQAQAGTQVRETVKVDADRLDLLVDMVGELVIAESMVSQSGEMRAGCSPGLARSLTQLDKITRELQEMGTGLRMVPIRATFQKMARLIRDLAKKSGKQVEFVTSGEETELDKSVVDKIGDPLIHMVRNAVDHGLEAGSDERRQAGKPPAGRVELRAFHKGGSIHIEIEDDGRGLDRNAILAKARARGLVREGDVLSDREVWDLVFAPGLSTAKTVTDVSGRGVGMDVVRRNIDALRGQVEIQSEAGKGTTFSVRLPLTLAIIDGMVVRIGHERYIVPTLSIVMSIRPEARQISTVAGRGEMLALQGRLLPLFRLARLFDIREGVQEITEGIVMVVEDDGRRTGLLVDEILGQQQIVIKSLGEAFQGLLGIAGAAIMPDGTVGLILDVGGVVRVANEEKRGASRVGTPA